MTIPSSETVAFEGRRITSRSARSFDDVLARFAARLGKTVSVDQLLALPGDIGEFERRTAETLGDSGFVSVSRWDYTRWVAKYGIERKVVRWIFGNPLIAITMIRHDLLAALSVPVNMVVTENDHEPGCSITYFEPSSLIAIGGGPELLAAAQALDGKFAALVHAVAGD